MIKNKNKYLSVKFLKIKNIKYFQKNKDQKTFLLIFFLVLFKNWHIRKSFSKFAKIEYRVIKSYTCPSIRTFLLRFTIGLNF